VAGFGQKQTIDHNFYAPIIRKEISTNGWNGYISQIQGAVSLILINPALSPGLYSSIIVGLFLSPPAGIQWLVPVYYLKLLVGFTSKD
jgi:hypothetical protein